jgi:hypothetical protein
MTDTQDQGALTDAAKIIERFGGIRPMASKMAVPVTTVQGWKKRDIIPENRREDVLKAAVVNNIDLSDLIDKKPANENTGSFGEAVSAVTGAAPSASARPRAGPEAKAAAPDDESAEIYDDTQLKTWIKSAQARAVRTSMLVSVPVTALVTAAVIFVLFPGQQRLTQLEREVEQQQAYEKNLMPPELLDSIAQLKQQVQSLRNDLDATSQKINSVTNAPGAGATALMDRVMKLQDEVAALAGPGTLPGLAEKIRGLEQTDEGRQTLTGAVSALAGLAAPVQDPAQLETVLQQAPQGNTALEQIMAGIPAADMKSAVLILIEAQLRESLERGTPIIDDLTLLQKVLGNQDQELSDVVSQLMPSAAQGVTTPKALAEQFGGLSAQIVQASLEGQDVSVVDKAKAGLGNVLQVRKDGNLISGTDTQAKLDHVQQLLRSDDIGGAISALQSLPDGAAKKAQPFIDKAQVTLLTQRVSSILSQRVSQLTGGGGAKNAAGQVKMPGTNPVQPTP